MRENLVQHRGEPSIWDRSGGRFFPGGTAGGRWVVGASAGVLLLTGLRRRSIGGLLSAAGAASLALWAAAGADSRQQWLGRIQQTCGRWGRVEEDLVNEAAEESFPASDAPALTPASLDTSRATGTRGGSVPRG